jgi:proline dehydrogenase
MQNNTVSFEDTATAFAAKSDGDLQRAYWLFKLISYNWLVKISPPFVNTAIALRLPIKGIIRSTIFRHFCGGETIADCEKTIRHLHDFNIGTILDYSVEGKESETDFEQSLNQTLATIERAKGDAAIPFSVFKPTGIARFGLLEKKNSGTALTADEQQEYERFLYRFDSICKKGFENNVPIFVDAEESWIQDTIDEVATLMMKKYNRERVIVYNTLQLYRHDRLEYLKRSINEAKQGNYFAGFKLVRGAYMEKERARANQLNYASPIQPDKEATDRDYDQALTYAIQHIESVSICAGSHNEGSNLLLTQLMREKGLINNHPHIWFSQLYGMSDHISFNLSKAGYNVCKYVPYGPVTAVLPYLIRRAQENTSVAGQTGRELSLILTERKRRKK